MRQTVNETEDIRTTTPAGKSLKLSISAEIAREAKIGKYFTHELYVLSTGKDRLVGVLLLPVQLKKPRKR